MKESKVYLLKTWTVPKITNLIKITFVCRQRMFYNKRELGIWWKKSYGIGISGKPNRQLKYFMIGVSLIGLKMWFDFTWLGKSKKEHQKIEIKSV
ncbi:MAG: hypothetical protein WCP39_06465 [Chlamydiota bacterium]